MSARENQGKGFSCHCAVVSSNLKRIVVYTFPDSLALNTPVFICIIYWFSLGWYSSIEAMGRWLRFVLFLDFPIWNSHPESSVYETMLTIDFHWDKMCAQSVLVFMTCGWFSGITTRHPFRVFTRCARRCRCWPPKDWRRAGNATVSAAISSSKVWPPWTCSRWLRIRPPASHALRPSEFRRASIGRLSLAGPCSESHSIRSDDIPIAEVAHNHSGLWFLILSLARDPLIWSCYINLCFTFTYIWLFYSSWLLAITTGCNNETDFKWVGFASGPT